MGFGYLVLGLLVWLNPVYAGFTEWLAYTLILTGCSKLSPYGKGFKLTSYIGVPGLILSFANFILCGADILGFYSYRGSSLYNGIMLCLLICTFALRVTMLCGVYQITSETGIDKLKIRSAYCILLYSFLFVFDILQTTRLIAATSIGFGIVLFGTLIVGFVCFFLLFACLRMIVLEDDRDDIELPAEKVKKDSWWQKIKKMSEEDVSDNTDRR